MNKIIIDIIHNININMLYVNRIIRNKAFY